MTVIVKFELLNKEAIILKGYVKDNHYLKFLSAFSQRHQISFAFFSLKSTLSRCPSTSVIHSC